MRLLFCCEFYFPSVGGVQEVMRQIAERMVRRGHNVTVATTSLAERNFTDHNGVKIVEFGVSGNLVRGMEGETQRYREFVRTFDCDAILIKAAQQWTFDALWPDLDLIRARKVLIPCGFSGLFEPLYVNYFQELPAILRKFDHLIFYAEQYRDIDFARAHEIGPFTVIANGACEIEFGEEEDPNFRRDHGIPEDSVVLLTVGSMTGVKGHRELLEAFSRMQTHHRHVTLILNGNAPPRPQVARAKLAPTIPPLKNRISRVFEREGARGICARIGHHAKRISREKYDAVFRYIGYPAKLVSVWKDEGLEGVRWRLTQRLSAYFAASPVIRYLPASIQAHSDPLAYWMYQARREPERKLLIVSDYPRYELVQAYKAADLFVFASNIEYSPLVLFESVAAGTPFLSVPVGNAVEIARWTGAGMICPANKDERGYTRVDPTVLAQQITKVINEPAKLAALGLVGHKAWLEHYTWDAIATRYESILKNAPLPESQRGLPCEPA